MRRARSDFVAGLFIRWGLVDEARDATAQALAALRACGDTWGVARCCNQLGAIESARGNLRAARELFAQALAGNEALGDELGMSQVLGNLAELEFAAGAPERASRFINEALELATLGKNLNLWVCGTKTTQHIASPWVTSWRPASRRARRCVLLGRYEMR